MAADFPDTGPAVEATVIASDTADRLRWKLASSDARTVVVAAALAFVTFAQCPDVPYPPSAPHPEGRGDPLRWASLWLVGHRCFGDPDTPAQRQARSRLLRPLDLLLAECWSAVAA